MKKGVKMKHETWNELHMRLFPYCYESFLDLAEKWKAEEPPQCVVYVLEMSNNTVKIGVTHDFKQRKKTIKGHSGLTITREWSSSEMPRNIAFKVEHLCHDELKEHKTQGEFFNIPFDDACFTVALYGLIVTEGEAYNEKIA